MNRCFRPRYRFFFSRGMAGCLSAGLCFALIPTPAAQSAAAYPNPFVKSVFEHFDAWDTDHDGTLQAKEIDSRLLSPRVTGTEAAAAATLKLLNEGKGEKLPPLTKAYFQGYVDSLYHTGGTATTPAPDAPQFPHFYHTYLNCLKRIEKTPRTLFAADLPQLSTIHQGQIGDCYFLSLIGKMVSRDPQQVKGMAKPQTDGSWDITFPHGETAHVPPLTDGQLALSSASADAGLWVAVFEQAYGRVQQKGLGASPESDIATDSIKNGGSTRAMIHFLSGHLYGHIDLRGTKTFAPEEEAAARLPVLRAGLVSALKEKRLIAATISPNVEVPAGISPEHAYAVLSYDPAADRITLWNPHGEDFAPKGEPGLHNGYPTQSGVFSLPLIEFARLFGGVSWEQPSSETLEKQLEQADASLKREDWPAAQPVSVRPCGRESPGRLSAGHRAAPRKPRSSGRGKGSEGNGPGRSQPGPRLGGDPPV